MDPPPLLLAVSLTLPPDLHAISHIVQLINEYLLPITIDAAVYNDLRSVIERFGDFRAWTVRAMDGAATRGRLSIVQWLHYTRNEGCSAVAFTGAAANDHLQTLRWLILRYPQHYRPERCLLSVAENGCANIVRFLHPQVEWFNVEFALEAAAARGQVRSLEPLMSGPYNVARAFIIAAANGHVEVLEFFIGRGYNGNFACVNAALKKAARFGHTDVIKLLLPTCNAIGTRNALRSAAKWGESSVVQLLLVTCKFGKIDVAHALLKATENVHYEVVKLLIDNFPNHDENEANWPPVRDDLTVGRPEERIYESFINKALRSAAKCGDVEIVKILVERFPSASIRHALHLAVESRCFEVVEWLLHDCRLKYNLSILTDIGVAAESAVTCGDTEMAKLLIQKSSLHSAGRALNIAVRKNNLDMVKVFAAKRGECFKADSYKIDALVQAAKDDRVEIVQVLMKNSNKRSKEEAMLQLAPTVKPEVLNMILMKCELEKYEYLFTHAAARGVTGLIQLLIHRVDTNCIRQSLVIAASNGHFEVAKVLLDQSDLACLDEAVEVATWNGDMDFAKLLRERFDSTSDATAVDNIKSSDLNEVPNKKPRLK